MTTAPLLDYNQHKSPFCNSINSFLELGAYEALWCKPKASFKTIAEKLAGEHSTPSAFVPEREAVKTAEIVLDKLNQRIKSWFNIKIYGELGYPKRLRDATYPVNLLYYQGWWDLLDTRSIAVVGTRTPSEEGIRRAKRIVRNLVENDFTIISGLAKGIDKIAHETALRLKARSIGVIGTPLGKFYPAENKTLQEELAAEHLLISQVPVQKFDSHNNPVHNRNFFPERNKTMSALSEATIIIEAGNTSGTLIQAREALKQNRKLFILESCFQNPNLNWPHKFEKLGAIRVRKFADIMDALPNETSPNNQA